MCSSHLAAPNHRNNQHQPTLLSLRGWHLDISDHFDLFLDSIPAWHRAETAMGREKRQDTSTSQTAGVTDCDCDRYQRRNSARTDAVTEERQRTSELHFMPWASSPQPLNPCMEAILNKVNLILISTGFRSSPRMYSCLMKYVCKCARRFWQTIQIWRTHVDQSPFATSG